MSRRLRVIQWSLACGKDAAKAATSEWVEFNVPLDTMRYFRRWVFEGNQLNWYLPPDWRRFSVDIGGTTEAERRRREDRGAEGAEGDGVWGGVSPCPPGEGLCPLPRKIFRFLSLKGEFWCIMGAILCSWLTWIEWKHKARLRWYGHMQWREECFLLLKFKGFLCF